MLEISHEKEPEEYFLVTLDFASAQNRQASQDQILNKNGIDDVMYQLYGEPTPQHPKYGTLGGDMHTLTLFDTFVKTQKLNSIEVHDDITGKDWLFAEGMEVYVKRFENGKLNDHLLIKIEDLKKDDEIVDYEKKRDK
jgi:hypothetical protein